ncbi:MAG: hypothetical protein ACW972_10205 [Promethearchaeota archaeon]
MSGSASERLTTCGLTVVRLTPIFPKTVVMFPPAVKKSYLASIM